MSVVAEKRENKDSVRLSSLDTVVEDMELGDVKSSGSDNHKLEEVQKKSIIAQQNSDENRDTWVNNCPWFRTSRLHYDVVDNVGDGDLKAEQNHANSDDNDNLEVEVQKKSTIAQLKKAVLSYSIAEQNNDENGDVMFRTSLLDSDVEDVIEDDDIKREFDDAMEDDTLSSSYNTDDNSPSSFFDRLKKAAQKKKTNKRKEYWKKIDFILPILIAMFTFISSLTLFIQAKSYMKPMFSRQVLISISTGEALGVIFEIIRFYWKPGNSFLRSDRVVNYMFSSLVALIYGVILQEESIYWTRFWIVATLPMAGAFFKSSKDYKWPEQWSNFFGTVMLIILVYRITLIGAVWEFSNYNWGLLLLLLPLLYVEMIWVSALCPFWLRFQKYFKNTLWTFLASLAEK